MGTAPSPIDRGWAWVICAAGFFLHIIVVGTIRSTGILLANVSEHYNRSKRDTSWIMGLMYLVFLLLTPVTMALARRYTARLVVFIGGVVLSLGYTLSYFAESLEFLYLTVGLLIGAGMSLTHPPTILLVNYYFDRHRTVAMGITMAGCSVGALCMPALMNALIDRYTFRGSMLLWGGLMLNVAVASVLMRPFVGAAEAAAASAATRAPAASVDANGVSEPLKKFDSSDEAEELDEAEEADDGADEAGRHRHGDRYCKSAENLHCRDPGCVGPRRATSVAVLHQRRQRKPRRPKDAEQRGRLRLPALLQEIGGSPPNLTLVASCGDVSILVGQPASVAALGAPTAAAVAAAAAAAGPMPPLMESEAEEEASGSASRRLLARLGRALRSLNLNMRLLRSPRVWFLLTSLALAIQGMPFNFMILPQHGKTLGMSATEYTRLLQYQGITDFVVRIGIGVLADRQLIRRQLMMVMLIISQGALWCLLLHPTPSAALAFALLEGLLAGGMVTNLAPILVDTFGVDNLPTTYGFMGILESSIMIGVPVLLGDMFDKTGSWNASIIFVAIMIASSGVMLMIDDLLHQRSQKRIEKQIGEQTAC